MLLDLVMWGLGPWWRHPRRVSASLAPAVIALSLAYALITLVATTPDRMDDALAQAGGDLVVVSDPFARFDLRSDGALYRRVVDHDLVVSAAAYEVIYDLDVAVSVVAPQFSAGRSDRVIAADVSLESMVLDPLDGGRWLEWDREWPVAMLGHDLADRFGARPNRSSVLIDGIPVLIVGVLPSLDLYPDIDQSVIVTHAWVAQSPLGDAPSREMIVLRSAPKMAAVLSDELVDFVGYFQDTSLEVRYVSSLDQLRGSLHTLTRQLLTGTGIMLLIAAVAIGVIVLIRDVRQRVVEIGLMIAFGATPAQVLWAFALYSWAASTVVAVLGWGGGVLIVGVARAAGAAIVWPKGELIGLSVAVGAIMGVLGLLPALRAASLDPGEVLLRDG